ncbi:hypothetical protein M404DRAFT_601377 [Pisolithus tinctorius Marx 270]|uniref:Uncharacterized protein n=1 Tax=Pisolithus tinctorius Marx 270 TaxID=870435 RepID=A0A0C3J4R6_PISTI|nr:hypothetical protein M404DRAFT_601377 [Pisolithus tinctorius Marx 270]
MRPITAMCVMDPPYADLPISRDNPSSRHQTFRKLTHTLRRRRSCHEIATPCYSESAYVLKIPKPSAYHQMRRWFLSWHEGR